MNQTSTEHKQMSSADIPIFITNFNSNFTGVSSTAAAVLRVHDKQGLNYTLIGHDLPGVKPAISKTKAIIEILRACKYLLRGQHIVIHVRRNSEMQFGLFLKCVMRLPIKLVFTSAAIRRHSWYPRQLIHSMDTLVTTSEEAGSFLEMPYIVIPHGVDCYTFKPSEELPENRHISIATFGRIRPEKGTDLFVKTMFNVLPYYPMAKAYIVGKATPIHSTYLNSIKADIKKNGFQNRIVFTGEIDQERTALLMREISLLVTLPVYEGFGMTVLEGLASGVPFVASNTGYFAKFSDNGKAGIILHKRDPVLAGIAIRNMLKKTNSAQRRHCRSLAVNNFSVERESHKLLKIYNDLGNNMQQRKRKPEDTEI